MLPFGKQNLKILEHCSLTTIRWYVQTRADHERAICGSKCALRGINGGAWDSDWGDPPTAGHCRRSPTQKPLVSAQGLPTNEGLRLTEKKEGELSSEGERASYVGLGQLLLAAELANYRLQERISYPEIQLSGQGIGHRRLRPKPCRRHSQGDGKYEGGGAEVSRPDEVVPKI